MKRQTYIQCPQQASRSKSGLAIPCAKYPSTTFATALGWRIVSFALLLGSLPIILGAQTSSTLAGIEDDQYTIKENVDYVVLHPTVQDRHGSFVAGLSKD